ncbi:MAG: sugar phosphate isomerase/epimerase [Clostridia bacterium]|nr:sugar phosphate isomerase/epimerase [Clostridia bacterium]
MQKNFFFVNTYDCSDIAGDLDKMFNLLEEENIKGLQIPYDNLTALDKEDFKKRLNESGVRLVCTHIVARLLSKDETVFESAINGCKRALEYINYFGCEYFMVVPFTPTDVEGFDDRPRAMQNFIKGLKIITEEAKKYGIKVIIENISQLILPFSKIEDLEYILDNVKELGFCFDTGNFLCMGIDDTTEAFERLKDRIEMVHIKELELCGVEGGLGCDSGRYVRHTDFGKGQTNLSVMLSKLYENNKDVPFIIEVQNGSPELSWIKQASKYFDEFFGNRE